MLIKNARIVSLEREFCGDVLIKDGVIEAIGRGLKDDEVIDIEGAYLLPGVIDLGVRLMDDRIHSANLDRLSTNALKGGVTTLALLPDTDPCICDEITLEFVKSHRSVAEILPLVQGIKEDGLSEISILLKKGALSVYVASDVNPYLLARIFEYAKMHQKPLFIEPKNSIFRDVGVMNEGEVAFRLGLGGISKLEEQAEVAKIIQYSEFYEVPVLFKAVSTTKSLEMIAKSRLCYAEVSLHHLLFSDEACEGYNTLAKLSPPLREEKERQALLEALKSGKVDLLSSLHSPKSMVSKDVSFDEAGFGIDSLGYYLPLLFTKLVQEGIISFSKLTELVSANAACFLNRRVGKVQEGFEADLVVFDPKESWRLTIDSLYKDTILQGRVQAIIKQGVLYWQTSSKSS